MQYLHYAPSCSNLCIHCIGGCGCVCLFVVCLCCLRSSLLVVVVVGSRDEDDQVKRKLCVFTRLQFISVVSCYCWGSIQTCMVRCKREREREVPFSPQGRFLKVCADTHTHTHALIKVWLWVMYIYKQGSSFIRLDSEEIGKWLKN